MTEIILYTQTNCRLSEKAKQIFQTKKFRFLEKDVTYDVLVKREMIERTGGRATTPQIFVKGKHIGSFQELHSMDQSGNLDQI
jgi:glutaredoxin 3